MKNLRIVGLMMTAVAVVSLSATAQEQGAHQQPAPQAVQQPSPQFERQRPIRAANMAGKQGRVTEAASDHYVITTSAHETIRVNITEHTRIVGGPGHIRQPEPAPTQEGEGAGGRVPQGSIVPATISPSEIVAGDYITTVGELDAAAPNTINASMIAKLDPERVKEMKAREAEFGKSWLSGRITAIAGSKVTIAGSVDGQPHTVLVDEKTSFIQRRDSVTLADLHVGDIVRIDGTGTPGSDFHAVKISAMGGRLAGGALMVPHNLQGDPTNGPPTGPGTTQQGPASGQPAPMPSPAEPTNPQ